MKLLNGKEIAEYIKQRQLGEVRSLVQAKKIKPKLAIIVTTDNPVIKLYVGLKKAYGQDIGVDVDVHNIAQNETIKLINQLNQDNSVHGIIIQLPLDNPEQTDEIVNLVDENKDVDALGNKAKFDPATPTAILWLLAGYNIDFRGKKVLLIGEGKLVGKPLLRMLRNSEVDVTVANSKTKDLKKETLAADIIITATGSPAILNSEMIKKDSVVVDAGVASENGKTVGDVDKDLYSREDIRITPQKGGVGPLTVSALFHNVLIAARRSTK